MSRLRKSKSEIAAAAVSGKGLLRRLLTWFTRNRRPLPWRDHPTPYSIWISEVMLQQTVVKAVIPYYQKWMTLFPNVGVLAKASERDVLTIWEGLGYYSRARNLLKAARFIVLEYGGEFPDNYALLRKLPGIGNYTAAAIMSIAYGKPYIAIEANVRRVVARLLNLKKDDRRIDDRVESFLDSTIPSSRPGEFNEALMELGQTVCLNRDPRCGICPLNKHCLSYKKGVLIQVSTEKPPTIQRGNSHLLLIISKGRILAKEKRTGLFAGLWVFPTQNADLQAQPDKFLSGEVKAGCRFVGELTPRIHHYTNHVERLLPKVYRTDTPRLLPQKDWQWIKLDQLGEYPVPSTYRKIINDLEIHLKGP